MKASENEIERERIPNLHNCSFMNICTREQFFGPSITKIELHTTHIRERDTHIIVSDTEKRVDG